MNLKGERASPFTSPFAPCCAVKQVPLGYARPMGTLAGREVFFATHMSRQKMIEYRADKVRH